MTLFCHGFLTCPLITFSQTCNLFGCDLFAFMFVNAARLLKCFCGAVKATDSSLSKFFMSFTFKALHTFACLL